MAAGSSRTFECRGWLPQSPLVLVHTANSPPLGVCMTPKGGSPSSRKACRVGCSAVSHLLAAKTTWFPRGSQELVKRACPLMERPSTHIYVASAPSSSMAFDNLGYLQCVFTFPNFTKDLVLRPWQAHSFNSFTSDTLHIQSLMGSCCLRGHNQLPTAHCVHMSPARDEFLSLRNTCNVKDMSGSLIRSYSPRSYLQWPDLSHEAVEHDSDIAGCQSCSHPT
jgi:hypothetical protein